MSKLDQWLKTNKPCLEDEVEFVDLDARPCGQTTRVVFKCRTLDGSPIVFSAFESAFEKMAVQPSELKTGAVLKMMYTTNEQDGRTYNNLKGCSLVHPAAQPCHE